MQKAVALLGNTVFAGSRDYNIYALNAKTGRGKWNMKEGGSWVIATPLIHNGKIYFGTSDSHNFYCMDARYGTQVWKQSFNMRIYGTAALHDSTVYLGCFNGRLYGLNAGNGKIISEFRSKGSQVNYHTVYDSTDRFRSDFPRGADFEKGEMKLLTMGSFVASPLIVDGVLYCGASDGYFYAINIKQDH